MAAASDAAATAAASDVAAAASDVAAAASDAATTAVNDTAVIAKGTVKKVRAEWERRPDRCAWDDGRGRTAAGRRVRPPS